MYEFFIQVSDPYWLEKVQLHHMDTDSFVLSFDADIQELTNVLQHDKKAFDFSDLDESHELYDPIHKKV